MTTPREPLTPEERALADFLATDRPDDGPSPDLDARILGAARDAVREPEAATPVHVPAGPRTHGRPGRRPRRRWTVGAGIAASLLLAVSITWQLRPQRTSQVLQEGADMAAAPAAREVAPAPAPMAPPPPAADITTPPTAPAPLAEVSPAPAPVPPPVMSKPLPARRKASPVVEPAAPEAAVPAPTEADATRPVDTYTPPAPPAPPAPTYAPPPPAPSPAAAAPDAVEAFQSAAGQQASSSTEPSAGLLRDTHSVPAGFPRQQAAELRAAQANRMRPSGAPIPLEPGQARQLEQDRRLPPGQWLQRIRLHRFEGQGALARASLMAFEQAHPDVPVPEDLRALRP